VAQRPHPLRELRGRLLLVQRELRVLVQVAVQRIQRWIERIQPRQLRRPCRKREGGSQQSNRADPESPMEHPVHGSLLLGIVARAERGVSNPTDYPFWAAPRSNISQRPAAEYTARSLNRTGRGQFRLFGEEQ